MSLNEMFEALAGQRIAGGCDDCDAYQELSQQDGVYLIEVRHDDTCPFLRARRDSRRKQP